MRPLDLSTLALSSFPGLVCGAWSGWGGTLLNNHWAQTNTAISSSNIALVTQHCKIADTNGQSSPPTIWGDFAYYPTWNGSFIALNYKTCQIKWSINVSQIIANYAPLTPLQTFTTTSTSRTSPQIDPDNNVIFFATQAHALIVAVDLRNGAILAQKQVNPHPHATITASPTFYNNLLIVGVASGEENAAFFAGLIGVPYECCDFIGNAAAFRFTRAGSTGPGTFTTVWNVTTIPTNLTLDGTGRWSGAGIWGGQPTIDTGRRQVIFATGNTYSIPASYIPCSQLDTPGCLPEYIWQEAVFALDIYTGRTNWVRRLNKLDAWTLVCGSITLPRNETLCPQKPGNDSDFGMAPALTLGSKYTPRGKDILTVGQKTGVLYGLSPDNGRIQWATLTSPGDALAGLSWGVAADDKRVYFTGINNGNAPWVLQPGNTQTVTNSLFGAASLLDGSIVWETAAPNSNLSIVIPAVVGDLLLTGATGPYAFSSPGPGTLIALKKATGQIVFEQTLDGPFQGAIAVHDKYIFLGTGYKGGTGGSFYVFKLGS
ncbi:quinon protein alcohol dehydrogenase-like superfamily [Bombardia bombarda]|uniref:Quinon protein alcohol dehydrogenase-like superfamily n=1 Tax=Bombardia bombarda TaxID=252184 RepID=A0AA39X945_9PEZI|nr:quinon protein alcohol dehydrogenase-like superfamily [Bombardia bombarda]